MKIVFALFVMLAIINCIIFASSENDGSHLKPLDVATASQVFGGFCWECPSMPRNTCDTPADCTGHNCPNVGKGFVSTNSKKPLGCSIQGMYKTCKFVLSNTTCKNNVKMCGTQSYAHCDTNELGVHTGECVVLNNHIKCTTGCK